MEIFSKQRSDESRVTDLLSSYLWWYI